MVHVLLVSFAGQGHVNPFIRLAKRIASKGAHVTFSSIEYVGNRIRESSGAKSSATDGEFTPVGRGRLRFEFFSDGWEPNDPRRHDLETYMPQLKSVGSVEVAALIRRQAERGRPVSCVVNNPFVPWVLDVAAGMGIPAGVLWVQSCAVYSTYYHYYHALTDFPDDARPELAVDLPGVPTLRGDEIPTFLRPSNPWPSLTAAILGQFENLSKASWVFVNSFEELERGAIEGISGLSPVIPVGPLVEPPPDGEAEVRGDLLKAADCVEWLDSREPGSVVYVSVGSVVVLGREEMEEMAEGLKSTGRPFLWVVRGDAREMLPEGFEEETGDRGMVVGWSPQDRVLAHRSVACFLTHCGWNSTLECLTAGVPVVAFPQFGDQVTDAKFLVDVYKVGVHLRPPGHTTPPMPVTTKKASFTRGDLERCVAEVTQGPRAEEMRSNAVKWKEAAKGAVAEGGSSDRNILAFVEEIGRKAHFSLNK